MPKPNLIFDGVTDYTQGDIFYPGASSLTPVRPALPPIAALGTGYVNRDVIPVINAGMIVQNQQATLQGLGVQAGTSFVLQPLAPDNSITQAS